MKRSGHGWTSLPNGFALPSPIAGRRSHGTNQPAIVNPTASHHHVRIGVAVIPTANQNSAVLNCSMLGNAVMNACACVERGNNDARNSEAGQPFATRLDERCQGDCSGDDHEQRERQLGG